MARYRALEAVFLGDPDVVLCGRHNVGARRIRKGEEVELTCWPHSTFEPLDGEAAAALAVVAEHRKNGKQLPDYAEWRAGRTTPPTPKRGKVAA